MDFKAIDIFVGSKLKNKREESDLSQRDLAKLVDLSYQQVQKYERGENRIGASMLYRFANVLNVEIAYFFEGYDHRKNFKNLAKRKKVVVEKYHNMNSQSVEELLRAFAALPPTARKNILGIIKDFSGRSK